MDQIRTIGAGRLAAGIADGRFSAREVCETFLAAIEGDRHNSVIALRREEALAEAAAVDRDRAAGVELPSTAGLPVIIKDNIVIRGEAAHHLRLENPGGFPQPLRCPRGGASARGPDGGARQGQHG